ncbi:hypothetical protein [Phenylobacterium sp.]|uniref:hypothetical protein n=1 Tax=Phenylobacterium sp. TaxID=1871053 RepID=UPI0025CE36C0|nr:hypothetical protein [Phenylobacterium sp.]MBX3485436.1 hypothetical protein [Phenylobacterium sp.]MCW5760334.1 hypothetical protein [Phenylobacterium sp.]
MNRRVFMLAAVALSGCAGAGVRVAPADAPLAELEPVYRADAGREAITISVASNGCTAKADFAFHVERRGGATTLAFARRRIDTCKSFAMGRTELTFTWAELGVAPRTEVFLLNPLSAWTGPGA